MSARLIALALAGLLTAATAAQAERVVSPETERIKRCKAELSINGAVKVEQRGRSLVAVAGGLVDDTEAKAINDCVRTLTRRSRNRDFYPLYASAPNCYRNAPILYRGGAYCFRGR